MIRRRSAFAAALVVALAAAVVATPAHAADGDVSWGVQPSTPSGPDGRTAFDFQVAPGTRISDWVAVTNHSAQPATFRVYAADATTDYDTASFTLIGAEQGSRDLGSWTTIDKGPAACADTNDTAEAACAAKLGVQIDLAPGARADIPITIDVPQDATPGDHAAGIVASYTTAAPDGTGVKREDRVGTRIYLRVDGPLSPGLGVRGVVAGYAGSWNPIGGGTASVAFDVANIGNTRISAAPTIRLAGPFGISLGTVALDPVANVMPGGTAHVKAELLGVPPLLLAFADLVVEAAPAAGTAASDPLPARVNASAVAWAVPWIQLGIIAVIAGGVWLVLYLRRRSRDRLAEDLAVYAEQVRADALREPESEVAR